MSGVNLLEALDNNIEIIDDIDNWEEAVKLAGQLLLKAGAIETKYINKMIDTCKELGPYIAVAPGVAIPHARPEDGAIKLSVAIVIIKKGVNFGSHNDPVHVVIAFSTPDKTAHTKILQELAQLLMNGDIVDRFKRSSNNVDVRTVIREIISKK